MSQLPRPSSSPSPPAPPQPSIGAVDGSAVASACALLSGLSFPLSPSSLSSAVGALLQLPSSTRASQVLHRLALHDRSARNAAAAANAVLLPSPVPLPASALLLPPSSPSSPFFSPLYSVFLDLFFSTALHCSLANPLLCGWCLDVLTAGQDSHSFLTTLKHTLSHSRSFGSGADASSSSPSSTQPPSSSSCGRPFAEGELAYTCTQCQMDPQWSALAAAAVL